MDLLAMQAQLLGATLVAEIDLCNESRINLLPNVSKTVVDYLNSKFTDAISSHLGWQDEQVFLSRFGIQLSYSFEIVVSEFRRVYWIGFPCHSSASVNLIRPVELLERRCQLEVHRQLTCYHETYHELRTPLQSLFFALEAISYSKDPTSVQKLLESALRSCERMKEIISRS